MKEKAKLVNVCCVRQDLLHLKRIVGYLVDKLVVKNKTIEIRKNT
jgi:hypothetical protein